MATKRDRKYDGVRWSPSRTGAPVLEGVVGYVDCTVEQVHEAGDHYVVIGRVQELGIGSGGSASLDEATPLTFFRGRYGTHRDA